ncbi:MAG: OB-fold nucleic acid binding domain-containing protein [Actinomycetes bacterium]|jgi:RecG-like helicase
MKKVSKFRSWLRSFYASDEELAAYELSEQAEIRGSTLIEEIDRGKPIQVTGVVKSATVRPNTQVPTYEVEVFDGSGSLTVIWQGRKHVTGVEPGTRIEVEGRITFISGKPCLHNPVYKILSSEER